MAAGLFAPDQGVIDPQREFSWRKVEARSMLPFTREQFIAVFVVYNNAIWPLQLVAYLIGFVAFILVFWPKRISDRIIVGTIAVMWLWTGIAYHGFYFSLINKAARLFGTLFVAQAVFMAYAGVLRDQLRFGFRAGTAAWVGIAFVVYAAVLYPVLGFCAAGHGYPEMPMFGVTPCPVAIFTFGMLLLTTARVPRWLLGIPFIWSLIGGSAAFVLGVVQDWLLLISGVIAIPLVILRDRRRPVEQVATHV
jgi:Family of unknown function (DUF6064)